MTTREGYSVECHKAFHTWCSEHHELLMDWYHYDSFIMDTIERYKKLEGHNWWRLDDTVDEHIEKCNVCTKGLYYNIWLEWPKRRVKDKEGNLKLVPWSARQCFERLEGCLEAYEEARAKGIIPSYKELVSSGHYLEFIQRGEYEDTIIKKRKRGPDKSLRLNSLMSYYG